MIPQCAVEVLYQAMEKSSVTSRWTFENDFPNQRFRMKSRPIYQNGASIVPLSGRMRLVGITLNRHDILYICIDDYILTITGSYISPLP